MYLIFSESGLCDLLQVDNGTGRRGAEECQSLRNKTHNSLRRPSNNIQQKPRQREIDYACFDWWRLCIFRFSPLTLLSTS